MASFSIDNENSLYSFNLSNAKKGKRVCLYEAQTSKAPALDNTQLVETPIKVAEKLNQWALVASPNKPPDYP